MANKITKKDNFKAIMEVLENTGRNDLVEVMAHEIELLEKKASNAKKTKNQEQNEVIKEKIVEVLTAMGKATITELLANNELNAMVNGSNQKTSALMTQLKNDKIVERLQEGKKAYFQVAE